MKDNAITEISNPAAIGIEWTNHYLGCRPSRHQLVWPRGTYSMRYGTERPDGTWLVVNVDDPERFGIDGTLSGARKAFKAFLDSCKTAR